MMLTHDDLERAWSLRMSSPAAAWSLAEAHLPVPEARVLQAYLAWRAGSHNEALEALTLAAAQWSPQTPTVWQARAVGIQGDVLMQLGQGRQALSCFEQQLQWGGALGDAEMQGLAHNDIGVLLIWDDPDGARQRYQMAYDVFQGAGTAHRAGLGLAAFNLSVAYHELGDADRSDALLSHALDLLQQTRAWPYWVGTVAQRALRLAEAGHLEEARQLSLEAELSQPQLPLDSLLTLQFFRAKLEAQHGAARTALTLLDTLQAWIGSRQDMLDDYLEVQAQALYRDGQPHKAYLTMRELLEAVRRRHDGERATQLKALEVLGRLEEAQHVTAALRTQATVLESLRREASELSLTDDLTGVGNRRAFEQWIDLRRQEGLPVVMAFIDLDHFKAVNDRYGHAAGDQVLQEVVQLLRQLTRPGDLLARLGGDEFVVTRADSSCRGLAEDMERLRAECERQLRQPCALREPVTLSIGVIQATGPLADGLRRADEGMYQAKRAGRNQVRVLE
ncbi:diguanylate cyclase [Deinococcus rubellus]|uniref:GGDEF domain-containing protein n=1 Tax=Deinococcus rubellus TaxID=1889240 RepID=UPI0031EFF19B